LVARPRCAEHSFIARRPWTLMRMLLVRNTQEVVR
jgi:hypothetical protein